VSEIEGLGIMPIFDEHDLNSSYIPIDFIKDNTIQIHTFKCNWCGNDTNDIHMSLHSGETLYVCVGCIVKTLDKVLGRYKNGGEK